MCGSTCLARHDRQGHHVEVVVPAVLGHGVIAHGGKPTRQDGGNEGPLAVVEGAFEKGRRVGPGPDIAMVHLGGDDHFIRQRFGDFPAPVIPVAVENLPTMGIGPGGIHPANPNETGADAPGQPLDDRRRPGRVKRLGVVLKARTMGVPAIEKPFLIRGGDHRLQACRRRRPLPTA